MVTCLTRSEKQLIDGGAEESRLIEDARGGSREAFEALIQKHKKRLMGSMIQLVGCSTDAEDLASMAFIRAYERLEQFRNDSSFYTWLYRIALNEWHHWRRRAPSLSLEGLSSDNEWRLSAHGSSPDEFEREMMENDRAAKIQNAMAALPHRYRQMLYWHFIYGASYQAMARRLDVPLGTVMSRLFKARQLLQEAWETASL